MNVIDRTSHKPRAKRASSAEVADRVAVRRALAGIVDDIASLQREAVFLRAQLSWQPAMRAELMPRIVTLGKGINAANGRLNDVVETLSEQQRRHSRLQDVQRALEALLQSVPRVSDRTENTS